MRRPVALGGRWFKGWWYAQRRWAKFIGLDKKEGTCSVCGSTDWWYRPASELGDPGERPCGRCHPKLAEDRTFLRSNNGQRLRQTTI